MKNELKIKSIILCLVFFVSWGITLPEETAASEKGSFDIEFNAENQTLSISADGIALSRILNEIEALSGAIIYRPKQIDDLVYASFKKRPLEKAIDKVARNYSKAVIYDVPLALEKPDAALRLKEIWLFRNGAGSPNRIPGKPVPKTKPIAKKQTVKQPDMKTPNPNARKQPTAEEIRKLNFPLFDDRSVSFWANQLYESDNYDDKKQSVIELKRIGSDEAFAAMVIALGDANPNLRYFTIEQIKTLENDDVWQIVGQSYLGDKDARVRRAALEYFTTRAGDAARAMLKKGLKDKDPQIRSMAQKALAKQASP